MNKEYGFETKAIHQGFKKDHTGARAVPIYQTSSYLFEDTKHAADLFALDQKGFIYSRIMNPTVEVFEERMAALENGVGALATSSGQAAETLSILNIAGSGDQIVSSSSLYGGTINLFEHTLSKLGIEVRFVEPSDMDGFQKAITPHTKALYAESIGNPSLDVLDLEALSAVAHSNGIPLIIDNTLASPYLLRPLDWGADIVIHSATKFICGQGTTIAGVIIDSGRFDWNESEKFKGLNQPDPSYHGLVYTKKFGKAAYINKARVQLLRDLGACLSPFNAFLLLLGLETLAVRMERHSKNAMAVAEHLDQHPQVNWVRYPGLDSHPTYHLARKYLNKGYGAMVSFGIKGGLPAGQKFIESLQLFSHLANIGDAKSLAIHPATTTHQQLSREQRIASGITDDFIRLSIGLETLEDIMGDLNQALDHAKS